MINNTLSAYGATPAINTQLDLVPIETVQKSRKELETTLSLTPSLALFASSRQAWLVFGAAIFLVSVPVFIEAPIVRSLPLLSFVLTGFWIWLSFKLMSNPSTYVWGDLLLGFSWSWLAGAIYWGWLRWEPLWHLPVECIGLPFACWCLLRNWGKVGNLFYLGSLLGTVLTDLYFYLVDLMPAWRQIMRVEPSAVPLVLHSAVAQVLTPWGETWALILGVILLSVGILPLLKQQRHWYAFSGAVLSTILVDSLFLLAAIAA